MFRTTAAAVLGVLVIGAVPVHAQDGGADLAALFRTFDASPNFVADVPATFVGEAPVNFTVDSAARGPRTNIAAPGWMAAANGLRAPSRGAALPGLYASLVGLQAYDGHTTLTAVRDGARETNPLLGTVANHAPLMWAVKVGATGASIFTAERLWRRGHRGQAIALMLASNGVMAAVAARNISVIRGQR